MSEGLVVGGGIAGLVAARELTHAGVTVTLLEARERLGGRLLQRGFNDTDKQVELGGAWFSLADMEPLAREVERYGLTVVRGAPASTYRWFTAGELRDGAPLPAREGRAFERAMFELGRAVRRIEPAAPLTGLDDLDVSAGRWISDLALPRASREFLLAWAAMYGGCDPGELGFLSLATDIAAFGCSAYALVDGIAEHFAHGTPELVGRLAEDSTAEIRCSTPVRRIEQDGGAVRAITDDGHSHEAAIVVLAVPINALAAIELEPAPEAHLAGAARSGQPCRSIKLWALVDNAPAGLLAAGWGPPLEWLGAVDELDGAQLLVGFGHDRERLDPDEIDSVEAAIRWFVPDARVRAVDRHDWEQDRWSAGAWGMWRPGWVADGTVRAFQEAHGRLAYATSDIAPEWPGWIAGAISSGQHAARLLLERL